LLNAIIVGAAHIMVAHFDDAEDYRADGCFYYLK